MANGDEKNLSRLCGALDGFYVRHGAWPSRVRVGRISFEDIQDRLLTPSALETLQRKVRLVQDRDATFVAEDDFGRSYNYGADGFPATSPPTRAEEYLAVVADRAQHHPTETSPPAFDELFDQLFAPGATWWKDVDGEVRQARGEGRYLEQTLAAHMGAAYRAESRRQYFFTRDARSRMDGRVGGIAVEEKVVRLDLGGIIDGAISRGLVWTLGNPLEISAGLGALGLCVVKDSAPLPEDLAAALLPVAAAIRGANVELVFVNGSTGERWPSKPGARDVAPRWLVGSAQPEASVLSGTSHGGLQLLDDLDGLELDRRLPGSRRLSWATPADAGDVAYAEWDNPWQMLDVGLLLRAMGFGAVKVKYRGPVLHNALRGVEERVERRMRDLFGVVLDWGTTPRRAKA